MKISTKTTELFLGAIRNKNRFAVLQILFDKSLSVNELSEKLGIEQSLLSHHLKCLLNCRLIEIRKDGRRRVYSLDKGASPIINAIKNHIQKYEEYIKSCDILRGPE